MPSNAEKRKYVRDRRTERAYRREKTNEWASVLGFLCLIVTAVYAGGEWAGKEIGIIDTGFDRVEAQCDRFGGVTESARNEGGFCYVRYPTGEFQVPIDSASAKPHAETVARQREECADNGSVDKDALFHADTGICESKYSELLRAE